MTRSSVAPEAIQAAFVAACEAELAAPKPGNVHIFAGGHGMAAEDFMASARAAAPFIAAPEARVGDRILGAVEATWAAVGQNTNLGIVLLCAPLAAAALAPAGAELGLRAALVTVLQGLDVADADAAFRAIRRARPAGLGDAPTHDVAAPAQTTLREAMRVAAARDRIAFQYDHAFVDVFDVGGAALAAARARGADPADAALAVYLAFLSAFPDSHVARKYGERVAAALCDEARAFRARVAGVDARARFAAALAWDAQLKTRRLNPGTSADLTVAILFADRLTAILASDCKNG
jgi:triphosphoribosyl-dephospho-CoA synthase